MKTILKFLITSIFFSNVAYAGRYVIELKNTDYLNQLKKDFKNAIIEPIAKAKTGYFSRTFTINSKLPNEELLPKLKTLDYIKSIEAVFTAKTFGVIPADDSKNLTPDLLFSYQWSLLSQGQKVLREITPLMSRQVLVPEGIDIGVEQYFLNNQITLLKTPMIAIIDTGVDYNHPDLSHSIIKNKIECGGKEKVDDDNNGFIDDCMGWNFTEPKESILATDPMDTIGHGTHLAGIIAALHNDIGISGIAPKAKILPLKVIMDDEADPSKKIAFSDRLASAIVYAVKSGADIINLSLGWPRSLDAKYLREAINFAQSQGVFLVAAAGNNNSDEPIFPCAYEGVVCVGATGIDGKKAPFSNYGSTVDVMAPGESIISTYPINLTPELFNIPGYDYRSGTSQAAPMVSALLALIKGQNPKAHPLQNLSRLYLGTKKLSLEYNSSQHGQINVDLSLNQNPAQLIRPQLKSFRQIIFNSTQNAGTFNQPILNYSDKEASVKMRIESLSENIEVTTTEASIELIKPFESKPINFNFIIKDMHADSTVKLKIEVIVGGESRFYFNELPLVRDIRQDKLLKQFPVSFTGLPLPLGSNTSGQLVPFIMTVDEYYPVKGTWYYLKKQLKEGDVLKGFEFTFFKKEEDKISQIGKPVVISDAVSFLRVLRLDANNDSNPDIVIQTIHKSDDSNNPNNFLKFTFLDENLNPLYGKFAHFTFKPTFTLINQNQIHFINYTLPEIGNVLVPIFKSQGMIPTHNQDLSVWTPSDRSIADRIYYLRPEIIGEEVYYQTNVIDHQKLTNSWREKYQLKFNSPIELLDLMPTTSVDFSKNQVRALYNVGSGSSFGQLELTIKNLDELTTNFKNNMINTNTLGVEALIDVNTFNPIGDLFYAFSGTASMRIKSSNLETNSTSTLLFSSKDKGNRVTGHLSSFVQDNNLIHWVSSMNSVISVRESGGKKQVFERPILRFSFLPGFLLSELYYPIIVSHENEKHPALYIDSTQITGNRISVLMSTPLGLKAKAFHNIFVPNNCKAMNPQPLEDKSTYSIELLCLEQTSWILKSIELN